MPKVLISDKMSPLAAEIFAERGLEVDVKPGMTPEELAACIGDYDGLAIRSATKVTADIIAAATNLKVVGRAGIGVDNVDINAATQRGIVVMNTPFGNAITTAEHAIAMLLASARMIPQASASTHAGKWEKSRFMGVEVHGKVLGLIGCGNIGAIVADRAQGLKMRVIGYDPYLSPERAVDLGIEKVELDDLFRRADFISLHTPLTDATRNIIDARAISLTRKGVRIINCARGGLVDESALKTALESGHVAAAALDVFAEEPATDNPLLGMDNVVCTPHLGASTNEAQTNVAIQVAEQISDYLTTGAVTNALNMPSVTAEEAPRLIPYMKLVEQMGSLVGQISRTGIKAVTVEYCGPVSELNCKPLTAALLAGLLRPFLDSVNMVSAPQIARDRDIEVREVKNEKVTGYQTLVRLTVITETQEKQVAGTLFANSMPRIVEINGVPIEAEISPNMIFLVNRDLPGLIGEMGTILGRADVNIASFHLGRVAPGGDAMALLQVDEPPSDAVLEGLRALPQVIRAEGLIFR